MCNFRVGILGIRLVCQTLSGFRFPSVKAVLELLLAWVLARLTAWARSGRGRFTNRPYAVGGVCASA